MVRKPKKKRTRHKPFKLFHRYKSGMVSYRSTEDLRVYVRIKPINDSPRKKHWIIEGVPEFKGKKFSNRKIAIRVLRKYFRSL